MSLRTRIVWYLLALVAVFALGSYSLQRLTFVESFAKLEVESARDDVRRVVATLERENQHLSARCLDLAQWDEMYEFVLERRPRWAAENLPLSYLRRNRLNLLLVCDKLGKVVAGHCIDPRGQPMVLRDFPAGDLGSTHPLIASSMVTYEDTGIWLTEQGALAVSAKPIVDGDGKGPVRGTVIVGRLLTSPFDEDRDEGLDDLRRQTGVDFEVWSIEGGLLETQRVSVNDVLTADAARAPLVRESLDNPAEQLCGYTALQDIQQKPALVVVAKIAREISAHGATTVRFAIVSTLLAGVLMVAVLLYLLQTIVLGPIGQLTAHAVEIGRSEDTTRKLELDREDEIGILSHEFDEMMVKLAESRAAVVKAARHAGMSEIATGVLHNVGNVLNSVNVSANLVVDKTKKSSAGDLRMAVDAVREGGQGLLGFLQRDPRGEHLFPLIEALSAQLCAEHDAVQGELKRLTDGIEHIKVLVHSQQDFAGHSGVLEATLLSEQVDAAIAMTELTPGSASIDIVREYQKLPSVRVDRHKLMQVLVNLIQNARQAMPRGEVSRQVLTVRVQADGDEHVRIEVEDTGVGIPPENLALIFNHGFTTKPGGHGFGLHSSANAATEMEATLHAHSEGPGRGARFVLRLPTRNAAALEAAA